jgi:formate dehydrogenase subunit gamma
MHKIKDGKWVERFSKPIIIAHWVHALSFIVLVATGLPVFMGWSEYMFGLNTKLLHRIFGITFILPTILILIIDRKSFIYWTKQLLSWGSHDIKFFTEFPKEFFGMKADVPKQGFYNAGQKLNSILTIFFSSIMAVSGLVLMHKAYFPQVLATWMIPMHALGAVMLTAVIMGHVFLSVGHPASRPSIRGMTRGSVDINYAKAHHGLWYDEVTKKK